MAQNRKKTCNWLCQVPLASIDADMVVFGVNR